MDLQWRPPSIPPKDGERILICYEYKDGSRSITASQAPVNLVGRVWPGGNTQVVIGWMPISPILGAPLGYDPAFGDNRLCLCGHEYYRHFDAYDNMSPVGCKYCNSPFNGDKDMPKYRKETAPNDVDLSSMTLEVWKQHVSLCSGFKWDGQEVEGLLHVHGIRCGKVGQRLRVRPPLRTCQ